MTHARERLALLAAMTAGIQVGAAMVATRFVAHDIGPGSLAFLRYAIGVACLLPFVMPSLLANRTATIARRDMLPVMILGIVQFAILIALLNYGLIYLQAARASLLFASFPLLTMLVGASFGYERLSAAKTIGVVFTVIGVGVTLSDSLAANATASEWIGAAAVLAAALCGAVCSVLYRPYLDRYPTLEIGTLAMFASVIFLIVPATAEGLFSGSFTIGIAGWGVVLFIGLTSATGYLLWLWALKHTTPTRVTIFLSLSPITATLLGLYLLGEPPTVATLLGLFAIIAGLWIATRTPATELRDART